MFYQGDGKSCEAAREGGRGHYKTHRLRPILQMRKRKENPENYGAAGEITCREYLYEAFGS